MKFEITRITSPNGERVEFKGSFLMRELEDITFDHIERTMFTSPASIDADYLLNLECIYRRWHEQQSMADKGENDAP